MTGTTLLTQGLSKRPTFDELIEYIEDDPDKVKYPDRKAKFARQSFQLSVLDNFGQAQLEQQQINAMKNKIAQYKLNDLAQQNATSVLIEQSTQTEPRRRDRQASRPSAQHGSSSLRGGGRTSGIRPSASTGSGSLIGGLSGGISRIGTAINPFTGAASSSSGIVQHPPEQFPPQDYEQSIAEPDAELYHSSMEQQALEKAKSETSRSEASRQLQELDEQQLNLRIKKEFPRSESESSQDIWHREVTDAEVGNPSQPLSVIHSSGTSSKPSSARSRSRASSKPISVRSGENAQISVQSNAKSHSPPISVQSSSKAPSPPISVKSSEKPVSISSESF